MIRTSAHNAALAALLALGLAALPASPATGTQFTQITADTTHTETDPTPSPDGKWLAFSTDRTGTRQVWLRPIGPDGRAKGPDRQLTFEPESTRAMTPTWAPDGKSLLFISTRTKQYNIYSIPFAGGTARPMSDARGGHRFASYSPDGSRILFPSNRLKPGALWGFNLYVMEAAGERAGVRDARQITNSTGSPGHPVWSPDGKWVAYVSKLIDTTKTIQLGGGMSAKQNAMFAPYRLWKVSAEGGKEIQLTGKKPELTQSEEIWPHWSPDGKWIAVQRRVGTETNVWLYDVATGGYSPLTDFGNCSKPTWSYDGKSLWFTRLGANDKETIWRASDIKLGSPAAAPVRSP